MTEETAPTPATSRTEVKVLRLHVSGLPGKITEKDLEERFRSFGKVLKVDLIRHPFEEGICRGFAYINLETSNEQLSKCMNVLNGCAWKGGKLQISFAKPDRFRVAEDGKVSIDLANGPPPEDKYKRKMLRRKKRKLVRHSSDFETLVTDKNVDKKKNWRRGRYGRAIACLKIRRPNRQLLIIDPSHYKNNLEKLFGSVRPRPLSHLTWTITDIIEEENYGFGDVHEDSDVVDDDVDNVEMENDTMNDVEMDNDTINEVEMDNNSVSASADTIDEFVSNYEQLEPAIEYEIITESMPESSTDLHVAIDEMLETTENVYESQAATVVVQDVEVKAAAKVESNFEVNVNWSSLFSKDTTNATTSNSNGTSLFGSMLDKNKVMMNVSSEELFKKPEEPQNAVIEPSLLESVPLEKAAAAHNYANLFADLNRITPTTAVRFGMHLSRKEELLQDWRIERIELKEDFKKKLAEGKRRTRRIIPSGKQQQHHH